MGGRVPASVRPAEGAASDVAARRRPGRETARRDRRRRSGRHRMAAAARRRGRRAVGGGAPRRAAEDGRRPRVRAWLGHTWTAAKSWIDTREHPLPAFLRLVAPRFAEYRREAGVREAALEADRRVKEEAAAKLAAEVRAAGITLAGLVELVDVSARTKPGAAKAKLAELHAGDRRLRIFETASEAALLVLESHGAERLEYGIERDEGLVADLKLFARAQPA